MPDFIAASLKAELIQMILSTFFINKKYIIDFRFIVIGSSKLNELNFNIIFLLNYFPKKIKRNEIEVNP